MNVVSISRRLILMVKVGMLTAASFSFAIAQDTVSVAFTEEPDTLVKQHFIDRYENVFMTKIPTRHMVKGGYLLASRGRL